MEMLVDYTKTKLLLERMSEILKLLCLLFEIWKQVYYKLNYKLNLFLLFNILQKVVGSEQINLN